MEKKYSTVIKKVHKLSRWHPNLPHLHNSVISSKHSNVQESLINFDSLRECHPNNHENFSFLMRLIHRNVVIPFLGAGFSANFGYPGWGKFMEEQAKVHNMD